MMDNLYRDSAKQWRRVAPAKKRVLDAKETAKRLEKKRFKAYMELIEDRKMQCGHFAVSDASPPVVSWYVQPHVGLSVVFYAGVIEAAQRAALSRGGCSHCVV